MFIYRTKLLIPGYNGNTHTDNNNTETNEEIKPVCKSHQQDLYHVFIDVKKASDRVWHAALWATMKKYNITTNLIQVIKNLCDKATSAVLFNSSIGDWF